jgi:hypothetical protein
MPEARASLLIIRLWLEEPSASGVRAHIRTIADLASGVERGEVVAGIDAVLAVVLAHLRAIVETGEDEL